MSLSSPGTPCQSSRSAIDRAYGYDIVTLMRSVAESPDDESPSYRGDRFPPDIISHAVWLYHRFAFSFRGVEDSGPTVIVMP